MTRRIADSDDFVAMPETPDLSIVCFRHVPGGRDREASLDAAALDAYQDRLQRALEVSGRGWVSTTTLRGRTYLRAGLVNHLSTDADVDRVLDTLRESSAAGRAGGGPPAPGERHAQRVASDRCRPLPLLPVVVSSDVPAGGPAGCRWPPCCGSASPRWGRSSRRRPTRRTRRRLPAAPRTVGFDISYPQCPWQRLPPGRFGIVGVNRGRPFTLQPVRRAAVRVGGAGGNAVPVRQRRVRPLLREARDGVVPDANVPADLSKPRPRLAWAVGCSEAAYSLANAPGPARWWWLDVETANSWGGRKANRTTITAAAAFLRRFASTPVGVYSTERSWWLVTGFGQWNPPGVTANWLGVDRDRTVRTAARDCGTGFSGMPVTLVQFYRHGPARDLGRQLGLLNPPEGGVGHPAQGNPVAGPTTIVGASRRP